MSTGQRSHTFHATDDDDGKIIVSNYPPDKLIGLTKYWIPAIDHWTPLLADKRSTLRVAAVLEDRLYHGFDVECELMLMTPDNWQDVLDYGKPDILLMESIWQTTTGHWHLGQYPKAPQETQELLEIVRAAKKNGIPTVFWMTKGHAYHEHYRRFAAAFDTVFCADPREVELLRCAGIEADLLMPCTQPALFNPFRYYDDYHALSIDFLFDGWADIDRLPGIVERLDDIHRMGLSIIESHYRLFQRKAALLGKYNDSLLGCVNQNGKIIALKYSKCMITLDESLSSRVTRQWDALDALASRLPIIHWGTFSDDDMRKHLVIENSDERQFLETCKQIHTDDTYRQATAHLGWRAVYQQHTYAHRLQTICKSVGINHSWNEYPKISLVCPTYRASYIDNLIDTFHRQDYPEKELVIVYNGSRDKAMNLKTAFGDEKIKFCVVPQDLFAGACLNVGYMNATGEYCFRIDDDDLYGDHYVSDMMLYLRAIDCNIFGKPPSGLRFKDEAHAYVRDNPYINCILTRENIRSRKVWIGGNTIASKRDTHLLHPYNDYCYGAADTDYQLNAEESRFLMMDNLNVVAERRENLATHTWKIDAERIKSNTKVPMSDLFI